MTVPVTPFSLKDAPALIERLLPVQKLSTEAYKEQMANVGKTLTALGSYWKGRTPLILNKACILGCLLPATESLKRDLEIFEKLMAMDDESFVVRWPRRFRPKEILASLSISSIRDFFTVSPPGVLPESAPIDWSLPDYTRVKVEWRDDLAELERRRLESQLLPSGIYRERVEKAKRPEGVIDAVHHHIWEAVNAHLGTRAYSFPDLVEQLGIMRFGHRPRVADTFCGSGQIPFEAARMGCDAYASELNPIAYMLTWGAFRIVGASPTSRNDLTRKQEQVVKEVQYEIDKLGIETDGNGWRAKAFLYCLEARCPQSGWMVPLLPSLIISRGKRAIVELVADANRKRYEICVRTGVSTDELAEAATGTVRSDARGQEPYLVHTVDGTEYRTKISTLRGDSRDVNGSTVNKLRLWEKLDFKPHPEDIYQERFYAIHWMRPKDGSKTCFLGSINETRSAFAQNYEILWEDPSPEGVKWVEEEFEALWKDSFPLPDAIVEEIKRVADRVEIHFGDLKAEELPAAALVESPIYRGGEQLQSWQRAFVTMFLKHRETYGKARLLLADEVGVGKTLSLAASAMVSALLDDGPVLILCPSTLTLQWAALQHRTRAAGFMKTLLLQRICSSFASGKATAEKMLRGETLEDDDDARLPVEPLSALTPTESGHLRTIIEELSRPEARDPKLAAVNAFLTAHRTEGKTWLEHGCIVFSQYYDTVFWIGSELARSLESEPIAVYAGAGKSGIFRGDAFASVDHEEIKKAVKNRSIRLVVATDAACEGLNLQTLGTLINVDLPWNPSRLEQRLGRIKRFGQARRTVDMLNLVYHETQDEKIYQVLSRRLKDKFDIFGGLPDTIEDDWIENIEHLEAADG